MSSILNAFLGLTWAIRYLLRPDCKKFWQKNMWISNFKGGFLENAQLIHGRFAEIFLPVWAWKCRLYVKWNIIVSVHLMLGLLVICALWFSNYTIFCVEGKLSWENDVVGKICVSKIRQNIYLFKYLLRFSTNVSSFFTNSQNFICAFWF